MDTTFSFILKDKDKKDIELKDISREISELSP